jgi:hypothetical protein
MLQENSLRYMTFAAHTIISCKYYYILLLWWRNAASSKDKRTPITTPPYKVPSVDVTPDPSTFSLDTTFKELFYRSKRILLFKGPGSFRYIFKTGGNVDYLQKRP